VCRAVWHLDSSAFLWDATVVSPLETNVAARCNYALFVEFITHFGGTAKMSAYTGSFRVLWKTRVNDAMIWFRYGITALLICASSSFSEHAGDVDLGEKSGKEEKSYVLGMRLIVQAYCSGWVLQSNQELSPLGKEKGKSFCKIKTRFLKFASMPSRFVSQIGSTPISRSILFTR
jgi:hypothetical protein